MIMADSGGEELISKLRTASYTDHKLSGGLDMEDGEVEDVRLLGVPESYQSSSSCSQANRDGRDVTSSEQHSGERGREGESC